MRLALGLVIVTACTPALADEGGKRARFVVGGSVGYGLHEAQALYRGTRVVIRDAMGPSLSAFGGVSAPLGAQFEAVVRGGLDYRFASNETTQYGMRGALPSGSMTFMPFVEAIARYVGTYYVGLGPRAGVVLARATYGSGSSAESVTATHPFVSGRLEAGRFVWSHWQVGITLSAGVIPRPSPAGLGVVGDAGLTLARTL